MQGLAAKVHRAAGRLRRVAGRLGAPPPAPAAARLSAAPPARSPRRAAVAATATPQSKEGFYYAVDGEEYGPFSTTQLEQWAEEGAFTEDFDARNAQTGWVGHLSDIVQFSGAVHNVSSLSFAQKLGEKLGASRGEDALHRLASRTKQRRESHIDLHAHVHTARIAAVPGYCERQLSAEQLRTHTRTFRDLAL